MEFGQKGHSLLFLVWFLFPFYVLFFSIWASRYFLSCGQVGFFYLSALTVSNLTFHLMLMSLLKHLAKFIRLCVLFKVGKMPANMNIFHAGGIYR